VNTVDQFYNIKIGFALPQVNTPGIFTLENPDGCIIAWILEVFGLPAMTAIPIVSNLLQSSLDNGSFRFGYAGSQPPLMVLGGNLAISCDTLDIGFIHLQAISVNLIYHDALDPFGAGQNQTILSIEGIILTASLSVQLSYDSLTGLITGSMRPLQPITVGDILNLIFGTTAVANALLPIIGTMNVSQV